MTSEEVNKLFYRVLQVNDKAELLNINLEIESLFHNNEIQEEETLKLQLAIHTKENELAIINILELLNEIALASAMDNGELDPVNRDKLH